MIDKNYISSLLRSRREFSSLPQPFYNDPDIFAFDVAEIFQKKWLMIGLTCELPVAGSYIAQTIGNTPVLILRDRSGTIRGYFNSCRHRGAQLCRDGSGRNARIVCPYHQWTYDLDGRLLHASDMPEDFDLSTHGLKPIHVRVVADVIYICLAESPPDFDAFASDSASMMGRLNLANAKLAHTEVLYEKANWKIVMENGRECYHCAACHPELGISFPIAITPEFSAEEAERMSLYRDRMTGFGLECGPKDGSWWQLARFPLNEGVISMTLDGRQAVSKAMTDFGFDLGSLRLAIEPNNFCHFLGDYAFVFNAWPVGPQETVVVGKWYVHKDAVEGVDYTISRMFETWDHTNRQDRDLAENNQRGVNGLGYTPGPYSRKSEGLVIRFVDWYCCEARAALGESRLEMAVVA